MGAETQRLRQGHELYALQFDPRRRQSRETMHPDYHMIRPRAIDE